MSYFLPSSQPLSSPHGLFSVFQHAPLVPSFLKTWTRDVPSQRMLFPLPYPNLTLSSSVLAHITSSYPQSKWHPLPWHSRSSYTVILHKHSPQHVIIYLCDCLMNVQCPKRPTSMWTGTVYLVHNSIPSTWPGLEYSRGNEYTNE